MHSNSQNQARVCMRCWKRNGVSRQKKERIVDERQCPLCFGAFLDLEKIADKVINEINTVPEANTFSIGTSIPKKSEDLEEMIWDEVDIENARSIKPVLNTEIGKIIEKKTKYKFNPDPDVRIVYRINDGSITKQVTSVYLYGRYNKYKRGIRQTKKIDSNEESVEGLIEEVILKIVGGDKVVLHGAGREDIDVLMLGDGRPVVIEIVNPKKRKFSSRDLKNISEEINKKQKDKIGITLTKQVNKEMVEIIKRVKFDKVYEALITLDKEIEKEDLEKIPKQIVLLQRTPKRVLIRRADLIRKRRIKHIDLELNEKNKKEIKAVILAQSGTYIKEFISGDDGRTNPSISSLLERKAECKELNVVKINHEWFDDFF